MLRDTLFLGNWKFRDIVDSEEMEHSGRMFYVGFPSFFGLDYLEDGHVPTFWLSVHGVSDKKYHRIPGPMKQT